MPCYTRTQITVNKMGWTQERADKAIEMAGLKGICKFENRKLSGTEAQIKLISQNYSKNILLEGAKRFGWTVNQEVKAGINLTFNLERR